ncbi:MAG: hypothetical protein JWN70_6251, partial [Planctomycetaceae bacterium]|nr:hypothetical protein [Planctomycetaceae bacterium]
MANATEIPARAVTLKQGIVIGALSLVLACVWFFGQPATVGSPTLTEAPVVAIKDSSRSEARPLAATPRWPVASIDSMLGHNPFQAIDSDLEPPIEPSSPAQESQEDLKSGRAAALEEK